MLKLGVYRQFFILTGTFFLFFLTKNVLAQNVNELIISEIMADPTPSRGLPEKEYIELYNRTDKAIDLNKFKLTYGSTTVVFPSFMLAAKSYAIVTNKTSEKEFQNFGNVIGLSSFSLLNTGTTLTLRNDKNKTIFSVTYSDKWYEKGKDQGFSLEIIDVNYPCVEEGNWTSSTATLQGTPAKENSVKANKPDLTQPALLRFEVTNSSAIKLIFSEKLDSLSSVSINAYLFDKSLKINKIAIESPQNTNVNLTLNAPFQENTIYNLSIKNISDCSGNVLTTAQIALGNIKPADSGNVVLNEILFNPRSGGEDFVEIYNRSEKIISLKNWSLANVDATGKVANIKTITSNDFVLQPKQFLVLTRNAKTVQSQYFKAVKNNFLEMSSLPSFPDDAGSVVLLNDAKKVFDRFDYAETFHHPLIDDKTGVSLEKVNFNVASSEKKNWRSAAASEGYATPGYTNSQGILDIQETVFKIEPEVFTPDGDGQDEVTNLKFQLDQNGFAANVSIFDVNGRKIKQLSQNQLLSVNGELEWDGKNDGNEVVSVGYYIMLVELFNPAGEKKEFKGKVVVGSKN
ncbi:lamin tail domain-containing protein [Emticicia sp. SJ17W-69]|uniref:lamin tail domain-containing protein n=1 Tax=Emticicia sp. SJ17W-69 TaxID=3421657 RepID=UPI003EBD2FA6